MKKHQEIFQNTVLENAVRVRQRSARLMTNLVHGVSHAILF